MSSMRNLILTGCVLCLMACGKKKQDIVNNDAGTPPAPFGTITVGSAAIARLAVAPVVPDAVGQSGIDAFMGSFGPTPVVPFRDQSHANQAAQGFELLPDGTTQVSLDVLDSKGQAAQMGTVAYIRPGLGNLAFSPANVILIAKHFSKVIILFTNMTDPTQGSTDFRKLTTLGVDRTNPDSVSGVPSHWEQVVNIPSSITNIYAVGSPTLDAISFTQQSDVTLEQLQVLHGHSTDLGFDALTAGGTVFAHSQGAADIVLTQDRLLKAGFHGFDNIVTIGSAIKGGRLLATDTLAKGFANSAKGAGGAVAGDQAYTALADLEPSVTAIRMQDGLNIHTSAASMDVEDRIRSYVTAAFGGAIDYKNPDTGNARLAFVAFSTTPDGAGSYLLNDGAENVDSTTLGQVSSTFPQVDHITSIEDPVLMKQMLQTLASLQSGAP
jgi:hypothetical protein